MEHPPPLHKLKPFSGMHGQPIPTKTWLVSPNVKGKIDVLQNHFHKQARALICIAEHIYWLMAKGGWVGLEGRFGGSIMDLMGGSMWADRPNKHVGVTPAARGAFLTDGWYQTERGGEGLTYKVFLICHDSFYSHPWTMDSGGCMKKVSLSAPNWSSSEPASLSL